MLEIPTLQIVSDECAETLEAPMPDGSVLVSRKVPFTDITFIPGNLPDELHLLKVSHS